MTPTKYMRRAEQAVINLKRLKEEYEDKKKGNIYYKRFNKYNKEVRFYISKIKESVGDNIQQYVFTASRQLYVEPNKNYQIWLPSSWNIQEVRTFLVIYCATNGLNLDNVKTDPVSKIIVGKADFY